jgi:hypothetical protein
LDAFLAGTRRINLIDRFQGKDGKGDAFPVTLARQRLPFITEMIASHRLTVIIGMGTARAMRVRTPLLVWGDAFRDGGSLLAICPHPSGVNRWWNDLSNVERARSFWHALFHPWDAPNKV